MQNGSVLTWQLLPMRTSDIFLRSCWWSGGTKFRFRTKTGYVAVRSLPVEGLDPFTVWRNGKITNLNPSAVDTAPESNRVPFLA